MALGEVEEVHEGACEGIEGEVADGLEVPVEFDEAEDRCLVDQGVVDEIFFCPWFCKRC